MEYGILFKGFSSDKPIYLKDEFPNQGVCAWSENIEDAVLFLTYFEADCIRDNFSSGGLLKRPEQTGAITIFIKTE